MNSMKSFSEVHEIRAYVAFFAIELDLSIKSASAIFRRMAANRLSQHSTYKKLLYPFFKIFFLSARIIDFEKSLGILLGHFVQNLIK